MSDHTVYLAARYSRRIELQGYATELRGLGYQVTSRWLDGDHEMVDGQSTTAEQANRRRFATEDLEDLLAADTVISFTEPPHSDASRGGRHVEFGVALAHGKRLIVVGPQENVFHCLGVVDRFDCWGDVLDQLRRDRRYGG